MNPDPRLTTFVVGCVTLGWTAALMVGLFTGRYQALIFATPLEAAIVGFVTGIRVWKNGSAKLND